MTTPPVLPEQPQPQPQPQPPPSPSPRPGYAPEPMPGQRYPQVGYRPPAPPPVSPSGQPLASFGDRLVAYIIDGLIMGAIGSVVVVPLYVIAIIWVMDANATGRDPFDSGGAAGVDALSLVLPLFGLAVLLLLFVLALSYLYHVELMYRTGQTLGKRLMKIRIIPVDPSLALNRGMAAKRFLVTVGCGFVPGASWLDGLWQLWDKPYQQCLHDKWPSTLVIKLNT